MRSAIVMSRHDGGAFEMVLRLVRFGLGGSTGSGRQFVSWVHDLDFIRAVEFLIARDDFEGPVNVAAPNPLPNKSFMAVLREEWGARIRLPAPAWLLEIGAFLLRTETELILKSRRVIPGKLLESGFRFQFPEWPAAAGDLVRRWRRPFHFSENSTLRSSFKRLDIS